MSAGKIASQACHAIIGLGISDRNCTIAVLKASDKKFEETRVKYAGCFVHYDLGYTEVPAGEPTTLAYIEK